MKKIILLLLIAITSCSDREKESQQEKTVSEHQPDSTSVKLSNKAVKLIGMISTGNEDSLNNLLYDSALFYLDQSIKADSLYLMAYTNKAQFLQRRGSLEQALEVLREVEVMKPDFAEVIMGQGLILEKMGQMELAHQKYSQALKAYEKRLENDPKNDKVLSDIAFLYIFLEDENAALDEIRDLILKNPESEQLKMMEGVIKDFDREKFIEEY